MFRIPFLVILALAALAAASAQTWSQPVREVENEARLAFSASCHLSWTLTEPGGYKLCQFTQTPAGKIFAVRNVSVQCVGRTGDNFAEVTLAGGPQAGNWMIFPLQAAGSLSDGRIVRAASVPAFLHYPQGAAASFGVTFSGTLANALPAHCNASIQGFLLDQ